MGLKAPPKAARHPAAAKQKTGRGMGRPWRRCRDQIFADRGKMCERHWELFQKVVPAKHGHHVKPREQRPDLIYDEDNVRCLCEECHEIEDREG